MSGCTVLVWLPRSSLELHIFPHPPHWWQVWFGDICFRQLWQKMFTAVSLISWSSISLCSERFKDLSRSSLRRFSGNCKSLCCFPLWTFKPRFDFEENPHWSHLNGSSFGPGHWLGGDVADATAACCSISRLGGSSLSSTRRWKASSLSNRFFLLFFFLFFPAGEPPHYFFRICSFGNQKGWT